MKIAVVDYGMGNLHSVLKSVQEAARISDCRADVVLTAHPEEVVRADKVVFPGQGAMPDCMAALHQSGLADAVSESLKTKPFFGICVGAQLLFEHSEEGDTAGLGWFAGEVKRFVPQAHEKVPHMGWNNVRQTQSHPLFAGVAQDTRFYFVHSYYFQPQDARVILANCDYIQPFACIVGRDNVFATQFHSEKSHTAGLQLLQNFLHWDGTF